MPLLPASHILPPIERIPTGSTTALDRFVAEGTRPWGGRPVDVPDAVTVALWLVTAMNMGFGGWLAAVCAGLAPCTGFACTITTWGRPDVVLVFGLACVTSVVAVAVGSRGLTEVRPMPLAVALVGAACGVVAVAGVIALLMLAVGMFAVAAALLITIVDRT